MCGDRVVRDSQMEPGEEVERGGTLGCSGARIVEELEIVSILGYESEEDPCHLL